MISRGEQDAELIHHHALDLAGRYPPDRAGLGSVLQHRLADVIAIEPATLPGVSGRHGCPGRAEEDALQQGRGLAARVAGPSPWALGENGVHLVPEVPAYDAVVLAWEGLALVDRLANVDPVVQSL
jgi:hypothetical protein